MTPPLPSVVARAIGADTWPDDPDRRGLIYRGLRDRAAKLALLRWAHAVARGDAEAPTRAAWAAVLSMPEATLRGLCARWPELAALPTVTPPRVRERRPAEELTDDSRRVREWRDRTRAGLPPRKAGRPPKTAAK